MKNPALLILIIVFFFYSVHFADAALVPCGTSENPHPCTLCDLGVLISNIIRFALFNILAPLAVLSVLVGGIMILTAGGDENRLGRGKSILWNTVLGIVIAFAAYLIVVTILGAILSKEIKAELDWGSFPDVIKLKCTD